MMKIILVAGARPNFMKIAPLMAAVLHLRPGLFLACAPAEAEIGGQPWDSAPIS